MLKKIGYALTISVLTACNSVSPEHQAALDIDARVDSALNNEDFVLALQLIDTLNTRYPKEIDLRKASDAKRAKALEQAAISEIPNLDATIQQTEAEIAQLRTDFVDVKKTSALQPYLLYKTVAKNDLMASAGIQPRVNTGQDADDVPWTIAVNAGRNIGLSSATVECSDGQSFTMTVATADGQIGSISPEQAGPLGQYLYMHSDVNAKSVVLMGNNGKIPAKISPATSQAIAMSWHLATLRLQRRSALVNRERLERRLQMARDAAANAIPQQPSPENQ